MKLTSSKIPTIDLFAGPGGLSEGFWRTGKYDICLSIEKDYWAHETLRLRAFFHQFDRASVPDDYYEFVAGRMSQSELYELHPEEFGKADAEAYHAELGSDAFPKDIVDTRIRAALEASESKEWLLIGGPPCQAYSLVGRARRHKDPEFIKDPKHILYKQYLRIIAEHKPTVFVMENVTGILTSRLQGEKIFPRICKDLQNPGQALNINKDTQYQLFSLREGVSDDASVLAWNYVLKAEDYGIPQARHRVIVVGVRADVAVKPGKMTEVHPGTTVWDVIGDIPKLRSKLSKEEDGSTQWVTALRAMTERSWFGDIKNRQVKEKLCANLQSLSFTLQTSGGGLRKSGARSQLCEMLRDSHVPVPPNHESRGHMRSDLWRYLYASTFAKVCHRSPTIRDFPKGLWPNHTNLDNSGGNPIFGDRFHVQLRNKPSSTVMAHISKDGHYYIHPDPSQCRSLTVREAARLQTFPDNYLFLGPRTEQFRQVGNAVPPLLAQKIADAVYAVFDKYNET